MTKKLERSPIDRATVLEKMEGRLAPFVNKASRLLAWARSLRVTNAAEYEDVGHKRKRMVEFKRELEELDSLYIDPLKSLYDDARARIKKARAPLLESIEITDEKLTSFRQKENARIAAATAKARLLAAAAAEKTLATAQAEANTAIKSGHVREAMAVLDAAVQTVTAETIEIPAELPKIPGLTPVKRWRAHVIDLSKVPEQYIVRSANQKMLDETMTATDGKAEIPGVVAVPEEHFRQTKSGS